MKWGEMGDWQAVSTEAEDQRRQGTKGKEEVTGIRNCMLEDQGWTYETEVGRFRLPFWVEPSRSRSSSLCESLSGSGCWRAMTETAPEAEADDGDGPLNPALPCRITAAWEENPSAFSQRRPVL
jgi:hypothetical protein